MNKKYYINYQIGGIYEIEELPNIDQISHVTRVQFGTMLIIEYVDNVVGEGASGQVKKGRIIFSENKEHSDKYIVIKSFVGTTDKPIEYVYKKEIDIYKKYSLNTDDLPFVSKLLYCTGSESPPLRHNLIYDDGGEELINFYRSRYCNLLNVKKILIDLFNTLYRLAQHDNMQNDLKPQNIVFKADEHDGIHIKLIDFGSSRSIKAFGTDDSSEIAKLDEVGNETNFIRRTNMNSPEAICNHLQKIADFISQYKNINFKDMTKWYYYPFISILCFLFTNIVYSSGDHIYIDGYFSQIVKPEYITEDHKRKYKRFEILKDNSKLKTCIKENKQIDHNEKILDELINGMCKLDISDRLSEDRVVELLNQL